MLQTAMVLNMFLMRFPQANAGKKTSSVEARFETTSILGIYSYQHLTDNPRKTTLCICLLEPEIEVHVFGKSRGE